MNSKNVWITHRVILGNTVSKKDVFGPDRYLATTYYRDYDTYAEIIPPEISNKKSDLNFKHIIQCRNCKSKIKINVKCRCIVTIPPHVLVEFTKSKMGRKIILKFISDSRKVIGSRLFKTGFFIAFVVNIIGLIKYNDEYINNIMNLQSHLLKLNIATLIIIFTGYIIKYIGKRKAYKIMYQELITNSYFKNWRLNYRGYLKRSKYFNSFNLKKENLILSLRINSKNHIFHTLENAEVISNNSPHQIYYFDDHNLYPS